MSVILDLTIFPMDQGSSVSRFVAPVIALLRDSGYPFRSSPMSSLVETETLEQSLALIARAQQLLDELGCGRVYAIAKFDIRQNAHGRLEGKLDSVREKIGPLESSSGTRLATADHNPAKCA